MPAPRVRLRNYLHDTHGLDVRLRSAGSAGKAVLDLLNNAVPAEHEPDMALATLERVAPAARNLAGVRGEAEEAAAALLADIGQARSAIFGTGYEDVEHVGLDVVRSFLEPVLGTPERARQFERFLLSLNAGDLLDDLRQALG